MKPGVQVTVHAETGLASLILAATDAPTGHE